MSKCGNLKIVISSILFHGKLLKRATLTALRPRSAIFAQLKSSSHYLRNPISIRGSRFFAQCQHRKKHLLKNIQQFVTAQHSLERPWREWMSTSSWNTSVGSPWQGSSYFHNQAPHVERFFFVVRDMTSTDELQVYRMVSFTTPCAPSNPSQQKIQALKAFKTVSNL